MFKTLTLAQIYEKQGLKNEALAVYGEILESEPDNSLAEDGVVRLSGELAVMRIRFKNAKNDMHYKKVEEWLAIWS